MSVTNLPLSGTVYMTLGGWTVDNTGLSQILVENRDFCLPCLHSTPPLRGGGGVPSEYCHNVWSGKTRMVWLPDGEKILNNVRLLVLTEYANVTDGRTDR